MGAWGTGPLENDQALDWLMSFAANPSDSLLVNCFEALRADAGRESLRRCAEAVAAAQIVVHRLDRGFDHPEEVAEWLRNAADPPSPEVLGQARDALDAIVEHSELRASWQDTADFDEWLAGLASIRSRL